MGGVTGEFIDGEYHITGGCMLCGLPIPADTTGWAKLGGVAFASLTGEDADGEAINVVMWACPSCEGNIIPAGDFSASSEDPGII